MVAEKVKVLHSSAECLGSNPKTVSLNFVVCSYLAGLVWFSDTVVGMAKF